MKEDKALTLNEIILLEAFKITGEDLDKTFTAEDLVVASWKSEPTSYGLRGYENQYPDSNKLYTKIDGQNGLVAKGYFTKVGDRTYKFSLAGLSKASSLKPVAAGLEAKLDRELQTAVNKILNNPEFAKWLRDSSHPRRFREAGNFWGIAPGTPPKVVRQRILEIEMNLQAALDKLEELGLEAVSEQRGKTLFEKQEILKCIEFQSTLKERFKSDLLILDPKGDY